MFGQERLISIASWIWIVVSVSGESESEERSDCRRAM